MADVFGPALTTLGGVQTDATTARPNDDRVWGGPDTWIKDCSSATVDDGTSLRAAFLNNLLGSLRTVARGNGLQADGATPVLADAPGDDSMLLAAIQHLIQRDRCSIAVDTGTLNALVAVLNPVPPELPDGFTIAVKAKFTTTAAATLKTAAGTAPVIMRGGTPTVGGEIVADDWHLFTFNKDRGAWQIIGPSVTTVAVTQGSGGASAPPQPNGFTPVGGYQVFTASGTFTPGSAVDMVFVRVWGAGGGGGGCGSNGASAAGGGGGYTEGYQQVTPGQPIAVYVGEGGFAGFGSSSGGPGGTSSFGSAMTATGGQPGGYSGGGGYINADNAPGGTGTGGGFSVPGGVGEGGIGSGANFGYGNGGSAYASSVSPSGGSNQPGALGSFPGGGGSGAASNNAGNQLGGAGANGLVVVTW